MGPTMRGNNGTSFANVARCSDDQETRSLSCPTSRPCHLRTNSEMAHWDHPEEIEMSQSSDPEADYWDQVEDIDMSYCSPEEAPTQHGLDYCKLGPSSNRLKRKADNDIPRRSRFLKALQADMLLPTSVTPPPPTIPGEDKAIIVVYAPDLLDAMKARHLPFGVLFEMARLVSLNRLPEVHVADLDKLHGSNAAAAPQTASVLLKQQMPDEEVAISHEKSTVLPWEELDKEKAVLADDPYGCLGNSAKHPGYYGGKITFSGKLEIDGDTYKIVLDRPRLGPSCQLWRVFGSESWLRIKVPGNILHRVNNNLVEFFKRPLVIWDRVYEAFFTKDDAVFLFWTNKTMDRAGLHVSTTSDRMSLWRLINWYNPLKLNSSQLLCKWSSRMALGLSNSVPGPCLEQENILQEPDIISSDGSDMTDGCGFASKALLVQLRIDFERDSLPIAGQFRCCGHKGLIIPKPDTSTSEAQKVFLRPSQKKIAYPSTMQLHPSKRIVDILRLSKMTPVARLSPEVIKNMEDNGILTSTLVAYFIRSIEESVEALTQWDGPKAYLRLWAAVERTESVCASRRAREAPGEARAKGYSFRGPEAADVDEDDDEDGLKEFDAAVDQRSLAWWPDEISGCPSSLAETVMVLLEGGFTPDSCPILREKLKQIVTSKIKLKTRKFRFEVEHSCSAFVIPDPYGVLGPDEIQIKSSRRNLKTEDGLETDIIVGDVLLTRNPCKVPTDVRKVKAVARPELSEYVDVIVCTIQGLRRLLDLLGGGDYDGDTAIAFWASDLVKPFKNADLKYSYEPQGLEGCFTRDSRNVRMFLSEMKSATPAQKSREIQKYLLGGLRDTAILGQYSGWHDNAITTLGYSNPRTVLLGYKFNRLMDSAKTGYKLRPETYTHDLKKYGHGLGPEWKAVSKKAEKKKQAIDETNMGFLLRPKPVTEFIRGPDVMAEILQAAKRKKQSLLTRMDTVFSPLIIGPDPDLTRPWHDATEVAEARAREKGDLSRRRDLGKIALHVQAMHRKHKMKPKGSSFTSLAIEVRQDTLRALSKEFASSPQPSELDTVMEPSTIARLRASYAYVYDAEQSRGRNGRPRAFDAYVDDPEQSRDGPQSHGWSRMPWDVCMGELIQIKASASGPYNVVGKYFHDQFKLPRNCLS